MTDTRNVTDRPADADSARFVLYSLCVCPACEGTGKEHDPRYGQPTAQRCPDCRGEGRTRREVASATDEQSLGVALVTCAREGEWTGECYGFGLLDREGETGKKWLVNGLWLPSARNTSDAGRTLAKARKGK